MMFELRDLTDKQGELIAIALLKAVRKMTEEQDRWRIVLLNDLAVSGPTGF